MNTQKSVYNKLFKEETQLASHSVELATINPADYQKKAADILDKANKFAAKANASLVSNYDDATNKIKAVGKELEKEFDVLQSKAQELGLDVIKTPIGKELLNTIGTVDDLRMKANQMRTSYAAYKY
jgi:lipid II:glycine glycyltransferase (peptidoglycan interpeptide bridge formation enzyme)